MDKRDKEEVAKQAILTGSILVELLEELNPTHKMKQQINRTVGMMDKYLLPSYDRIYEDDNQLTTSLTKYYEDCIKWMSSSPIEKQLKVFQYIDSLEVDGEEKINLLKLDQDE